MSHYFASRSSKRPFSVDKWCDNCKEKWADEVQRNHETARPREGKRKMRTVRSASG